MHTHRFDHRDSIGHATHLSYTAALKPGTLFLNQEPDMIHVKVTSLLGSANLISVCQGNREVQATYCCIVQLCQPTAVTERG